MKRNLSVLLFLALMAASSVTTFAQEIELVYTKANLAQVLDYKAEVTYSDAKATNALLLINVSPERAGAYVNTTASHDAVIIFGESAVKAVGDIA